MQLFFEDFILIRTIFDNRNIYLVGDIERGYMLFANVKIRATRYDRVDRIYLPKYVQPGTQFFISVQKVNILIRLKWLDSKS